MRKFQRTKLSPLFLGETRTYIYEIRKKKKSLEIRNMIVKMKTFV